MNPLIRSANRTSSTGLVGVSYHPASHKWQAQITCDKVHYNLGLYPTAYEASVARKKMAKKLTRMKSGLPV